MTPQQTQLLQRLDNIANRLADERTRIAGERVVFLQTSWLITGDPLGFRTRADSSLALIEQLERFVGEVLPRFEAAVRDGDIARGQAGVNAGERIIIAVGGYSSITDFRNDVSEAAQGLIASAGQLVPAPSTIGATIAIGIGLLVVLAVARR